MSKRSDAERRLSHLFPAREDSSRLTVSCRAGDFSASLIARAVEDCDAHLLNLNVTAAGDKESGELSIELRIGARNAIPVARSLERYGMRVTAMQSDGARDDDAAMRDRVRELLHYIEI